MSYDYWTETVESTLSEHGVAVTPEQIKGIVADIKIALECEHETRAPVENPLASEVRNLRTALNDEREKVVCGECAGRGSITFAGGVRSSTSRCWRCNGEGYRKP